MVVVPFLMAMPVRVDGLGMDMAVRMAIPEKETLGEPHEPEGDLAEQDRRKSEAEERGRGEEDLGARGAEPLGRSDIAHDARPVRERADGERATERSQADLRSSFDEKAHRKIDHSRRDSLDEGAGLRRKAIDQGGEVVVETPGNAGTGHQKASRQR